MSPSASSSARLCRAESISPNSAAVFLIIAIAMMAIHRKAYSSERKKKAAKTRIANKEKKLLEEEATKFGLKVDEFKKLYPKKAKQIKYRARAKSKSSVWTVRG